jgi:hypothetical protein
VTGSCNQTRRLEPQAAQRHTVRATCERSIMPRHAARHTAASRTSPPGTLTGSSRCAGAVAATGEARTAAAGADYQPSSPSSSWKVPVGPSGPIMASLATICALWAAGRPG